MVNRKHNKKNKELKVVFAPGCFDTFEGTQEELDELIAEIHKAFDGKTAEEIEGMSKPVDFDDLDEEEAEMLANIHKNIKKH